MYDVSIAGEVAIIDPFIVNGEAVHLFFSLQSSVG